jgi:hypothetical protein
LKARDDKDTELSFHHQTFFEVFSNFFSPFSGLTPKVHLVKSLFQGTCFSLKAGAKIWSFFNKTNYSHFFLTFFCLKPDNNFQHPFIPYII